jgi:hypothetical protein
MAAVRPFFIEPDEKWFERTHPRPEYVGAAGSDDLTDKPA